jgi:hypothetical protein
MTDCRSVLPQRNCRVKGIARPLSGIGFSQAGFHLAEEPASELITTVEVRSASEYDADGVLSPLDRQEQRIGLHPRVILTDGAFGTADVRAGLEARQIELVARLRPITDTTHLGKDEFTIDLEANEGQGSVTCPAGETTTEFRMARDTKDRPVRLFRFPLDTCAACSLRERCLGGGRGRIAQPLRPTGRQVNCMSMKISYRRPVPPRRPQSNGAHSASGYTPVLRSNGRSPRCCGAMDSGKDAFRASERPNSKQ